MTTELSMADILARLQASGGKLTEVSASWMQGRAAFGGLAAALAVTGMREVLPEEKTIRSLMVSFVGPVPAGPVTVDARLARAGRNVSQASAEVRDGDAVCVQALAAFGQARDTESAAATAVFKPEPRDSVPAVAMGPMRPPFLQYFDVHWTGGGIPLSGSKDRRLGKWVRHKEDLSAWPVERIVAIADIPPPVMMSHYTKPVVSSSLSWSLEFVRDPHEVTAEWFYLDYVLEHAADGYSQQSGTIFTEDGELVALSRQCMVYFERG
ncbi:thioesterase family protein [Kordiimonas marina]|uniref:thioesterase family protein n=1 Tax=Kordiimonas marina TaxID=2872312 RepID=UPI001FF19537|nr:thioesterase family protein [Kordiimonas marina]MCJ9428127.1 thioesterase family protein [Kordiimonas marina]